MHKHSPHFHLQNQCGVCCRIIPPSVNFVSLVEDLSNAELVSVSLHGPLNRDANSQSGRVVEGRYFCWASKCRRCKRGRETVVLHPDCFELFKQQCKAPDATERLWVAAISRRPWTSAPHLSLGSDLSLSLDLVYEKAAEYGLPGLRLLPPEIIPSIRDHSLSATFWRYIYALQLGRELFYDSLLPIPRYRTPFFPLCDVLAWTRGEQPIFLHPSADRPPHIRFTFDDRGLKQIERLSDQPGYQQWRSDKLAFGITKEDDIKNVNVQFEYKSMRLKLPERFEGFAFWDMPNPPAYEHCGFIGNFTQCTRFHTIDLHEITGLTFFFSSGHLYAIHPHTPSMPTAKDTFSRFSASRRAALAWVYFPLPKTDNIISVGVRLKYSYGRYEVQMPCFLIQTELAGDLSFGPYHTEESRDVILGESRPRFLIYNTPQTGSADAFGAYCPTEPADEYYVRSPKRDLTNIPIHRSNLSSAPLRDVCQMQVFNDRRYGTCRGIIFDYNNGAQRAVGDCRLGVDPTHTYPNPSQIFYLPITVARPNSLREIHGVRVGVECGATDDQEVAWVCSRMKGTLEFWFSDTQTVIRIVPDTDEEEDTYRMLQEMVRLTD